jgi:hypothetical protein
MKFACKFGCAADERVVVIDLTGDEIGRARRHADPELAAMAYALRRAYAGMPAGAVHIDVSRVN